MLALQVDFGSHSVAAKELIRSTFAILGIHLIQLAVCTDVLILRWLERSQCPKSTLSYRSVPSLVECNCQIIVVLDKASHTEYN